MPSSTSRATQVRVHLTTKDKDIELPQDTGSILVSTDLRRYQLSTLVNRLVDTKQTIPLEFIVNGRFLRTSLDDLIAEDGISTETTIDIEYVKSIIPPVHVASYQHDDALSSVDVLSPFSHAVQRSQNTGNVQSRILTGSFDNLVRVWNMSSEVVATGYGHTGSVKDVKFVSPTQIITTGFDMMVRLWEFTDPGIGPGSLTPSLELYGHRASVDSVAVHKSSSKALTGSADGDVGVWTLNQSEMPSVPDSFLAKSNKRRKLSKSTPATSKGGFLAMMKGHEAQVMGVCYDENDYTVAYSASQDHSVKTWDIPTSKAVDTRTTDRALYSMCQLPERSLIATGDLFGRNIHLVDPRAATVSVMTLKGHTNAVSSLARDPSSGHRLVSASHDSTCRIWDIRSASSQGLDKISKSMFVVERESQKNQPRPEVGDESRVFAVCWDKEVGIVSGGRDGRAQINRTPDGR